MSKFASGAGSLCVVALLLMIGGMGGLRGAEHAALAAQPTSPDRPASGFDARGITVIPIFPSAEPGIADDMPWVGFQDFQSPAQVGAAAAVRLRSMIPGKRWIQTQGRFDAAKLSATMEPIRRAGIGIDGVYLDEEDADAEFGPRMAELQTIVLAGGFDVRVDGTTVKRPTVINFATPRPTLPDTALPDNRTACCAAYLSRRFEYGLPAGNNGEWLNPLADRLISRIQGQFAVGRRVVLVMTTPGWIDEGETDTTNRRAAMRRLIEGAMDAGVRTIILFNCMGATIDWDGFRNPTQQHFDEDRAFSDILRDIERDRRRGLMR